LVGWEMCARDRDLAFRQPDEEQLSVAVAEC